MVTVSRNDPCPCGSGKKYKKCCLLKEPGPPTNLDEIHEVLAEAVKCMDEDKWAEAIAQFKKIENYVTESFSSIWAMATCYDMLEDFALAAEFYEKALEICHLDQRLEITGALGVSRGCAGRVQEARDAFEQALEMTVDDEDEESLLDLLDVLDKIQRGEGNPHLFRVRVGLQRAFSDMEEDKHEEAAARLENIKDLDPENAAIFYNLGVVYTFLRKDGQAIANYERALQLQPHYWAAWYNMGQICLLEKEDFSRALHCFDRALAIVPDYISAHHQKGVAYELLGDTAKAVQWWEKTLMLDPDNKQAMENIQRVTGRSPHRSDFVPERKDHSA